jgi:hypothetical protein
MECVLRHKIAGIALAAALVLGLPGVASAIPVTGLLITEVYFNAPGFDDGDEWIEIFNGSGTAITLSDYSLGWGRDSYTDGTYVLGSSLAPGTQLLPGETFVIGGPNSFAQNGNPVFDEVYNFAPGLLNGNDGGGFVQADAVALFMGDIATNPSLLPVHTVIYGRNTATTTLLDEQGNPATVMVSTNGGTSGRSLEYQADGSWILQASETPGTPAAGVPEPGTFPMMALALVGLVGLERSSRRR